MAKPGSDRARSIAQTGVDLSKLKPLSEEAQAQALVEAEMKLHMRCAGCQQRIGVGFRFVALEAVPGPNGKPEVVKMTMGACSGIAGCDFASKARKGATAVEMVEFVWLDADGEPAEEEPGRHEHGIDPAEPGHANGHDPCDCGAPARLGDEGHAALCTFAPEHRAE